MRAKNRKIFLGCFTASLFLHAMGLMFIQSYSLWFSSLKLPEKTEEWLSFVDKKERNQILKEALEPRPPESPKKNHRPEPESLLAKPSPGSVQLPEHELLKPIHFQALPPPTELLNSHPFLPKFSIPSETFHLLDYLPKDLIIPTSHTTTTTSLFSPKSNPTPLVFSKKSPILKENTSTPEITYRDSLEFSLPESKPIPKTLPPIQVPNLPKLPSLEELETSTYSDSFDADLTFIPKEEGSGYIFALTLIPRPDLNLPKIRQHFTFLIDRSNSIQQGRLTVTKSAIHKVLEELSPEDTFNIIAFDSKIEKMAPNFLPCTGKSFALAEEFIEKIQLGSFFSSGELSKPLLLTVPGKVDLDEIYTAILLTDGETLGKKHVQKALLQNWTQYNAGKVALYAIGLNSDPHLSTLETATTFNKGKLSLAPTNRGLKRKLLKLVKTIHNPVAKNLVCNAISRSPNTKIKLFPKSSQMPHLYIDQPYVILGETENLDDFILFIQGRLKNRWLNIKKAISFLNARKGNKILKHEWALQQAFQLYEQYVQNEDPTLIAEAERLLEPFDYPVAFR